MMNVYYTARQGRRNANGHTITRGEVYIIRRGEIDELVNIGEYVHQSGGAGIEKTLLDIAQRTGTEIGRGYCNNSNNNLPSWREFVNFIEV